MSPRAARLASIALARFGVVDDILEFGALRGDVFAVSRLVSSRSATLFRDGELVRAFSGGDVLRLLDFGGQLVLLWAVNPESDRIPEVTTEDALEGLRLQPIGRGRLRDTLPPHWVCQRCQAPIETGTGWVTVLHREPSTGLIGGYPREPTPERDLSGLSQPEVLDAILADAKADPSRVAFGAYHADCDAHEEGYTIPVERARTLEDWVGLGLHLEQEKRWMGNRDFVRMLVFWWSHRGDAPPTR